MTTETAAWPALTVVIEGTPHPRLSPNARGVSGWTRPKLVKGDRDKATMATRSALARPEGVEAAEAMRAVGRVRYCVMVAWGPGQREKDPDNMTSHLKAFIDGIAAEVGVDDRHWTPELVEQSRDTDRGGGFTMFVLWPADGAATDGEEGMRK